MKKFLKFLSIACAMLLLGSVFSSCSSDDEEDDPTMYTIIYDMDDSSKVSVSLTLFEYNDQGEKIGTNTMTDVTKGTKQQFAASTLATKVKIYIKVGSSSSAMHRWVQQVYYLEKGKNINITITGTTSVGVSEP